MKSTKMVVILVLALGLAAKVANDLDFFTDCIVEAFGERSFGSV